MTNLQTSPTGPAGAPAAPGTIPASEIPTDALLALARLRREAEAEIERLPCGRAERKRRTIRPALT
jgi:hypothetical protein